ncbi:MAG: hypothetical protein H6747_16560 [Deltaproteobacteria bacterium]|nr:hypothetical protein [Deltaproteobacteria bacterium]
MIAETASRSVWATWSRFALLAIALVMASGGCSPAEQECAAGTVLVGGKCVDPGAALCGAGTVWDEAQKICLLATADTSGGDTAGGDTGGGDTAGGDTGGTDAGGGDATGLPDSLTPDNTCTPNCEGRVCGSDGCGGSCGDCPNGKNCDGQGQCNDPPGCFPSCTDKVCGDDGCGGSCGTCDDPAKPLCEQGVCLAGCVPDCVGKQCGGDGCGGSCGACTGDASCSSVGHCVPKAWNCGEETFAGHNGCDCGCGADDPDCADPSQGLLGCAEGQICKAGACEDKVPKAWTCAPFLYDDGLLCNCACGAPDPDCADDANLIVDCTTNGCNKQAGVCSPCKANCDGKTCGSDGCLGTCGSCDDAALPYCAAGTCVEKAACTPDCSNKECGDDGCGGSCGACKNPAHACSAGVCAAPPDKSCLGICGYQAIGGCWCDAGCKDRGDCCSDVFHCYCSPNCEGKTCGDDGCGGSCGNCTDQAAPHCADGKCGTTCVPSCDGKNCGGDGCGGSCGSCAAGNTCQEWGKCVPDAWHCPAYLYGSGGVTANCDCGCGVPDPDCKGKGLTVGCPKASLCVPDKAYCDAKFCASQSACNAPAWCVGDYPAGDGSRKGVCTLPDPLGFAPGHPCSTDDACATDLCVHGSCRIHCVVDAHCPAGQACAGTEKVHPLTGHGLGVIGVCHPVGAIGKSCGKHAECAKDELCLALVEPKTLQPLARCGTPYGGTPEGLECGDGGQCQVGLLCAGGKCARPCHGGVADCAANQKCEPAVLHGGATSSPDDDVKVPACVSK